MVRKDGYPQRKAGALKKTVLVFYLESLHRLAQMFRPLPGGLQ